MKQIILTLNNDANIPEFIKLFQTFEGVSSFEFVEDAKEMSDEEYDEKFLELLEKSSKQIDEGKFTVMTDEKLKEIFEKYKK